ncbi:DUF1310 family protein [Streptococcus suis]|nr:DUF1310 family protein [Streptococcus suis]NQH95848.1 DUF1310 family protein [Streptococcus suis]NQO46992.1 DUF1310 family protein [Streptococcus suis]WNF84407.1 DUF1310 family protein [Streptococcus suis]
MKTWQKWLAGILASITILIGLGVIYQMNKEQELREEMIKIVESDEAKLVFERVLKNLDSESLTEVGTIKSYVVDYDSLQKNPMGGMFVSLLINENSNLEVTISLNRRNSSDELRAGGVTYSEELDNLLK